MVETVEMLSYSTWCICFSDEGVLKIIPRLPNEWGVEIAQMPIEGYRCSSGIKCDIPKGWSAAGGSAAISNE
jgi:hypothetical protein